MSAPLPRIAQATFRPFLPEDRKNDDLTVDLPNVELPSQQAQTIAIALHELASNSSRHGALSNGGKVSIIGKVLAGESGSQILHLRWDEQSTRSIRRPKRAGFGTRMLMSAMPEQFSGRASATWRSTGLLYEAWLKLPKLPTHDLVPARGPSRPSPRSPVGMPASRSLPGLWNQSNCSALYLHKCKQE